jgi:hypothetical protein
VAAEGVAVELVGNGFWATNMPQWQGAPAIATGPLDDAFVWRLRLRAHGARRQ